MRGLSVFRTLANRSRKADADVLLDYARRSLSTDAGLKEVLQGKIPEQQVSANTLQLFHVLPAEATSD